MATLRNFCQARDQKLILSGIVVPQPQLEHFGGLCNLLQNQLLPPATPVVATSDFGPQVKSSGSSNVLRYLTAKSMPNETPLAHVTYFKFYSRDNAFSVFESRTNEGDPPTVEHNATNGGEGFNSSSILLQVNPSMDEEPSYPSAVITGSAPGDCFSWLLPPNRTHHLSVFQVPNCDSRLCLPCSVVQSLPSEQEISKAARLFALFQKLPNLQNFVPEELQTKLTRARNSLSDCLEKALSCPPTAITHRTILTTLLKDHTALLAEFEQIEKAFTADLLTAIEKEEISQTQGLLFIKNVLGFAHFYYHVEADLYIVSPGSTTGCTQLELLCGISIGCKWRDAKCRIVLTSWHSLDKVEVLPSLVHKVSSADVWYLDGDESYFTIDPWCEESAMNPADDEILVNPITHVAKAGKKFVTLSIKDFVPRASAQGKINTTKSNHLKATITPPKQSQAKGSDPPLGSYLESIGYEDYNPESPPELSSVLQCVTSPQVVARLQQPLEKHASEDVQASEIFPAALRWKVQEDSSFDLTATKTAATAAELKLDVPKGAKFREQDILEATLTVKDARSTKMVGHISLQLSETTTTLDITKGLAQEDSCGQTLADYLESNGSTEWEQARALTIGETLHLLLDEERACQIVYCLPLFLSSKFIQWSVNHRLTLVQAECNLERASIYMTGSARIPTCGGRVTLDVKNLNLHLFPTQNSGEHKMKLEGECIVNDKVSAQIVCACSSSTLDITVKLSNCLSPTSVFELLGTECSLKDTPRTIIPGTQLEDGVQYEVAIGVSQPLSTTTLAEITSLQFAVQADNLNLRQWLPSAVKDIRNLEVSAVILRPFSKNWKCGLSARFKTDVALPNNRLRTLECSLDVIPPKSEEAEHMISLEITPCTAPQLESSNNTCEALFDALSTLDGGVGKRCESELSEIPEIGSQLMDALSVQRCTLLLGSGNVKAIELKASLSSITFLSGNFTISECRAWCEYSEKGLVIECTGTLTFLQEFTTTAEFILPTSSADGRLTFQNFNNALTLEKILICFKLLSHKTSSHPILSKFLDVTVREADITLHSESGGMQITALKLVLYKKELDIRIVTFHEIELTVNVRKVNDAYQTNFQLEAYIADTLHAKMEYNSSSHLLTGLVVVTLFSRISAPETLGVFSVEPDGSRVNSFEDLSVVLRDRIMSLLQSSQNQKTSPGLTASLHFTVGVPKRIYEMFTLNHLSLQVKDALTIGNFILDTLVLEYAKTPFSSENSSTARLIGVVRRDGTDESSAVEFSLASKRGQSSVLTARLHSGPSGGLIKLSSAIELACCGKPVLPDVGMPEIFDIQLLDGSMVSFELSPLKVSALDVKVAVTNWKVFNDPELTIKDLTFQLKWSKGSSPELTFRGNLKFVNLALSLEGNVNKDEVLVEIKRNPQLSLDFQEALNEYSMRGKQPLEIPQQIDLPPVVVNLKSLKVHLREMSKLFQFNGQLVALDPWCLGFGERTLEVHSIGAVLEWEKQKDHSARYSAYIYGSLRLSDFNVDVQMQLGNEQDCIIAGMIHKQDGFQYDKMAGFLTGSCEAASSSEQSSFSELVPAGMERIMAFEAAAALNITRKQFFFSGQVDRFGSCSLFVGRLPSEERMKYVLTLSLEDGFRFSMLSERLAFIDDAVTIRSVNLVVSTVNSYTLSKLLDPYQQAFSQLATELRPQRPFTTLPGLKDHKKLLSEELKAGTTLYAEINIPACKEGNSLLSGIFKLGDQSSDIPDIILRAFVTQFPRRQQDKHFELKAWIREVTLVGLIKFSDIVLEYQLPESRLTLSGEVLIDCEYGKLHFLGSLRISRVEAVFEASPAKACRDVITKPAGFNVTVRDLRLELVFDLSSEKSKAPLITVSGVVDFSSSFVLNVFVLLKGISFKVFYICLAHGLRLSAVFDRSNIDWPVSSLDIVIKEGEFYYARTGADGSIAHKGTTYFDGFHMKALIRFLNSDFRIGADVSQDRSRLRVWGQCVDKINLFFAKLTSEDFEEGPMLEYSSQDSEPRLSIRGGVELLGSKLFRGCISYLPKTKAFEGEISYPGSILWIKNPMIKVRWSREDGFEIVDFSIDGGSEFKLLSALREAARILYKLVSGLISWNMKLNLRTGRNPDPDKYLVQLILSGSLGVKILGYFDIDFIPLPEIPINLLRVKNFSFAELPFYLLNSLWHSKKDICMAILKFINPWELAKKMGKMIIDSIKCVVVKVVELGKKVVEGVKAVGRGIKKAWGWCKRLFGGSAFILDDENNVIGYIYAGKGGRPLQSERFLVEHFGPFIAVCGVEKVATDLYTNGKACVSVPDDMKEQENEEEPGAVTDHESLSELRERNQELAIQLEQIAHETLAASEIEAVLDRSGNHLGINWQVTGNNGETIYSEDKGDIDHHVKVTATVLERRSHDEGTPPQIHTKTIYDEVLTRPRDSDDKWPFCSVDIEPTILAKAISVGVHIHPSVTMKVKTIPSNEPIFVEQELIDAGNNSWMDAAKKRIDEEGRDKEVTLHGKTGYKEILMRPLTHAHATEVEATARCSYIEGEISGSITQITGIEWYLVQVVDSNDRATVIAQKLVTGEVAATNMSGCGNMNEESESETLEIDTEVVIPYNIKLPDFSDPTKRDLANSTGPYVVTVIGLTKHFETSSRFEVPDLQVVRYSAPQKINQIFPDLNHSEEDTVKAVWTLSDSDISEVCKYTFTLVGSQPLSQETQQSHTESDDIEMFDFVILQQSVFPTAEGPGAIPNCHYEFKLKDILKKKEIVLDKPLTLYCVAATAGDVEKLPSTPVKAPAVTIVAPPALLQCSLSEKEAGLMVSWPYSCHALSYRLEFIDNSTEEVVMPRPKDHHFDIEQQSRVKGCNVDRLLIREDLKHLKYHGPQGYTLQVHALGFDDDLLRSPYPRQLKEKLQVLPVDVEYIPHCDTLSVKFQLHTNLEYHVELYQWSMNRKQRLARKTVRPPCSQVEFESNIWRSSSHQACTITGWVAAAQPVFTGCQESGETPLNFGVSSSELLILPPPDSLKDQTIYSSGELIVRDIALQWPQSKIPCRYEYGLCYTDQTVKTFTTQETSAVIDLTLIDPSIRGIAQLKCFVKSIGDFKDFISSSPVLSETTYFCIKSKFSSKLFTAITLCEVWMHHLTTAAIQLARAHLKLRKYRFTVFQCQKGEAGGVPQVKAFPEVPQEVHREFWQTEALNPFEIGLSTDDLTLPESGTGKKLLHVM